MAVTAGTEWTDPKDRPDPQEKKARPAKTVATASQELRFDELGCFILNGFHGVYFVYRVRYFDSFFLLNFLMQYPCFLDINSIFIFCFWSSSQNTIDYKTFDWLGCN